MKKKTLAASALSVLLASSMLTGCGSTIVVNLVGADSYTNEQALLKLSGPDTDTIVETEKMAAPSTDGWDESKKIYAYCWDNDFEKKLNVVLEKYPEYQDFVEIIVTGQGGTTYEYKTTVDTAFSGGSKYPSIVAADNDVAKLWSEDSSKTIPLSRIGITEEMYGNAYKFSKQYALYNGEITCMTWQACPGTFVYRSDIAEEVFGSADPEVVQTYLADWDTFFASAETLKNAGYYIVSGYDDIKYAVFDSQEGPWVTTVDGLETLTLDRTVETYFDMAKRLYDGGYVDPASEMWSSAWAANMSSEGNVFGYFGCPWFFGSMNDMGAEEGAWNCCVGPVSYHWGGTYVMAGKKSSNPELQAFLIYELCCDADIAYEIANRYGDCVNNKEANARIMEDGVGAAVILKEQNPVSTLCESALSLNLSNVTYADATIKSYIDTATKSYLNGSFSKEAAMNYVKKQAQIELGLVVEEKEEK